jgi:hypothetical protein
VERGEVEAALDVRVRVDAGVVGRWMKRRERLRSTATRSGDTTSL